MTILMALLLALPFLLYLVLIPVRLILEVLTKLARRRLKKLAARLAIIKDEAKETQETLKANRQYLKESLAQNNNLVTVELKQVIEENKLMETELKRKIRRLNFTILRMRIIHIFLKTTNRAIRWIANLLLGLSGIVGITTLMAISAAIITVAVIPGVLDHEFGKEDTGGPTHSVNHTNYEVMNIDWSQDFSDLYDLVEDEDGKEARDWVEFTITGLRVQQYALAERYEDGKQKYTTPGFINGFKGVETGSSIQNLGNTPLTKQEIFAGTYYPRSYADKVDTGPFQFDTHWEQYFPGITEYKGSERETKGGLPSYVPDAAYGLTNRFSTYSVYPNLNDIRERRSAEARDKAFTTLGVTKTPEKEQYVIVNTYTANLFNAIYLDLGNYQGAFGPFTEEQTTNAAYVNALVVIQYAELYGYGSTEATFELGKSIHKTMNMKNPYSLEKHVLAKALYGATGSTANYPGDLDKTTNFGVITETGNPVNGALLFYLTEQMPSKARDDVLNSIGVQAFVGSGNYHWRPRYDLTVLNISVYDSMKVYELAKSMGYD